MENWLLTYSQVLRDLALLPVAGVGSYFLYLRTKALIRQADAAKLQASISFLQNRYDFLDKAIKQLSSELLGERLHAIQKLQTLAEEEDSVRWLVASIFTSYLRDRWPAREKIADGIASNVNSEEIQKELFPEDKRDIIDAIGQKLSKFLKPDEGWHRFIDLRDIDFSRMGITDSLLDETDCARSVFDNAKLTATTFRGAYLTGCRFRNATLVSVDLTNADCGEVDFSEADFKDVIWSGTNVHGAIFEGAKNLSHEQLREAKGLETVRGLRFDASADRDGTTIQPAS